MSHWPVAVVIAKEDTTAVKVYGATVQCKIHDRMISSFSVYEKREGSVHVQKCVRVQIRK